MMMGSDRTNLPSADHAFRSGKNQLAALLIGLCAVAALGAPAEAQVRWRAGASARSDMTQPEKRQILTRAAEAGNQRRLVLQFTGPITPELRNRLATSGVTLTSYLGDHAFIATLAPQAVDASLVAGLPTLADVQELQPEWKTHPQLAGAEPPEWAVIPAPAHRAQDADGPWIPVYVLFHPDVSEAEALTVAVSHSAEIRTRLRTVNGLVVEMPYAAVTALAADDAVLYVEPALPAMEGINDSNRSVTQAEIVQAPPYALDGNGVKVLVFDAGTARATHVDFEGRLTVRDTSGLSDHATHVSGTIGGGGVANALYRGMAPGVTIESYGFEQVGGLQQGFLYTDPGDLEADYDEAINVHGADIANNSIGTNTANNGFPCDWEGDYGVTDTVIDSIVRGGLGAPFRIVWANGNERGSGRCGTTYHTTAPPACAKNHITVGALNSNDDSVTYFTSWGPTDDGRLKPDISAPGCQIGSDGGVTSCDATSDTAYTTFCGTSMASPTVTGLLSLVLEDYRAQFPGMNDPRNSTLKALLAHNAEDVQAPGPDYQSGYGSVRVQRTIDFLRTGSFFEATLDQGQTRTALVVVNAGEAELKVTLAWDDPPGVPNVIPSLINDVDLRVFSPSGVQHFPWTLGGTADPAAPAARTQADRVNNLEQVLVESPEAGVWTVEIHGFNIPQGPQPVSVCISPLYSPDCNANGVEDVQDVVGGTSEDCNTNSVPDECEPDADCNVNGLSDICDIAAGTSADVNGNLVADECEADCNGNAIPDDHDIATGTSADCNGNAVPDECDLSAGTSTDCSGNGVPDECEADCNHNGIVDDCDISTGFSSDCNANGIPDECESDCNENGIVDDCDITGGTSLDGNSNGWPDECHRVYVNPAAAGTETGWSWENAQREFQAAVVQTEQNVDITEVWVAAGIYTPAAPGGDRNATFTLRDGVQVYGGFAGTEAVREQRDWTAHETILSGDLNGDDGPDWANRTDNAYHVVTATDLGTSTILDGFTITGGYGTSSPGAALCLMNSSIQVANCRIAYNLVGFSSGGGVLIWDGAPAFNNCAFEGNYVHLGKGGAVYLYGAAGASFEGCAFISNTSVGSTSGSPEGAGAAVAHWGSGPLSFVDCVFNYNVSRGFYTAGSNGAYAGAIDHFGPGPMSVDRCLFTNNRSNAGGAIYTWKNATVTNSVFAWNHAPQFNSTFGWGGQGGAIGCQSFAGSTVDVTNCVFYGNTAEDAGGVGGYGAAVVTVANSILWNNTDNRGNVGKSQLSGASAHHSCIMNMLVAAPGDDPPDPAAFPACTAADPLFVAATGGDFHVSAGSPCIDSGDNGALPSGLFRDRDGRFRFLDDPASPDGGGTPPVVDMGAFEYGTVAAGDFDGNGYIDLFDYSVFAECLTGPNTATLRVMCEPFDFDMDVDVDLADTATFQALFSGGPPPLDPPATVSGAVTYTGTETGAIHVQATGIGGTAANFETILAMPGSYQLAIDRAGDYDLTAFLDVNGNQAPDDGEPAVAYAFNPVKVTAAGETLTGANMSLGGAQGISGRITWDGGFGAWNVAVNLSGTAADSTTTDNDGNYAFTDLADGSYTVTPASSARYFYPYSRSVVLSGSDVTGQDFVMHSLPSGEVDGEMTGTVTAVDAAGYNLTLDTGSGSLTLYVYVDTVYSGDANALEEIQLGWTVTAQYYTSANLAVELDAMSGAQ